jgi:hypothetical protein
MLEKMRDIKVEVTSYKETGTYVFKSVDDVQ